MNGGTVGRGCRPKSSNSQPSRGSQYDTSISDLHISPNIQAQEECSKLALEINNQVAVYRELLIFIGDKTDSPVLREDITKIRRKCLGGMKVTKYKLAPYLSSKTPTHEFQSQSIQLIGCMELFLNEMKRSYSLIKAFPMSNDFENIPGVLSATGSQIAMAAMGAIGSRVFAADAVSAFSSDQFDETFVLEPPRRNRDELHSLQNDIQECKTMLHELYQIMPRPKMNDEDFIIPEFMKIHNRRRIFGGSSRRINLCCMCVQDSL
ncbi:regulator of G-protein signaling 7-binding protein-like [Saccoglossus kowalevskii]